MKRTNRWSTLKAVRRRIFTRLLHVSLLSGAMFGGSSTFAQQPLQLQPAQQRQSGMQQPGIQQPVQSGSQSQFSTQSLPVQQQMPMLQTTRASQAPVESQATLQTYPVPSQLIGTIGAQLQLLFHNTPGVTITTDPQTGQLMVMAPAPVQQQIGDSIRRLMQQAGIQPGDEGVAAKSHSESTYSLCNITWRELEDAITKLAGSRLEVTSENNGETAQLKIKNQHGLFDILRVDRRNNQVSVLGTSPTVSAWTQVIHSLDVGQADPSAITSIIPLAPAQPRSIKRIIQLVKAVKNQQNNQQNNQQEQDPNNPDAPASVVVDQRGEVTDSGLLGDVQIEVVDSVGLIIIRGSKRDVQRTLQVIEQIKNQAKLTEPQIEILQLQYSNSEAVANLVNQLYQNVYQPRQGSVSITALVQPNALLLIGRAEVVQSVKELVAKIDTPLEVTDQLKVIRLKHAASSDLETRIRDFFAGTTTGPAGAPAGGAIQQPAGGATGTQQGLSTRVRISSDYRTNALIVKASPREVAEVEKLVEQLDVESGETVNRVKVFPLKHAISQELQQVLTQIISGQATTGTAGQQGGGQFGQAQVGGQGAANNRATVPSAKFSIDGEGGKVESGILSGVVISSDAAVNSLVVRAPAPSMPLIEALIEQLDVLPNAEARIKFFQLRHSDATTVAFTLQNLYGLSPSAGQGAQFALQNQFNSALTRATGLTAGGESTLVQLRITAEARSNSVIISGSEADLEVLEALVLRLDEDLKDGRRSEVIWLRNALAQNVATALTTYFQTFFQTQQQLASAQITSIQEIVNRQVIVVADTTSNSLLISANSKFFDIALSLIERLDRRPPMVTVQVLIAQVQLDDSLEFGTEFGLQDTSLFTRRSSTGGTLGSPVFNPLTTLSAPTRGSSPAGQGLSTLGVGRANAAGVGGLVLAASSETVGMLVRALQTAGRLEVLNRPQLTTLENQIATSQVGSIVPRVTSVGQGTAATPQTINTTDVDVGLLLSVKPRVSPDGLIVMDVGVENSSVGNPDTGIPIGFSQTGQPIRSPIISRTRAQTMVSAYSGQTVVFAGLISKSRKVARSQVPVLGSIPFLGAAFRFDVETDQRTELLVVLTPRIVQTDEDYEVLKEIESSRMSWCLADVLNMHGDVGLSGGNGLWGPARGTIMHPDRPAIKVPDRAPVDVNNNYPLHDIYAPDGLIEAPLSPVPVYEADVSARNGSQLRVLPASFGSTSSLPQVQSNQQSPGLIQNSPGRLPANSTNSTTPPSVNVQNGSYR